MVGGGGSWLHGVHSRGFDADQHLSAQRYWPVRLGNLQHLGTAESLLDNGMYALEHRESFVRSAAAGGG